MAYPYCDLYPVEFERLVVSFAKTLLGKGVQGFKNGRDGGRDARFEGTADGFPSRTKPWTGVTVIQAKHTEQMMAYFSDPGFGGDAKSSTLSEELGRVRRLREDGQLNNYLLVSNRFLTAGTNEELLKRISSVVNLPTESIHICGIEALEEAFIDEPDLARKAGIRELDGPLRIESRDLAEVVQNLSIELDALPTTSMEDKPPPAERTSLQEKDDINRIPGEYSKRIRKKYFPYVPQIQEFLADPLNRNIRKMYESCVEDFDLKIMAHSADEDYAFAKIFEKLTDTMLDRNPLLRRESKATRSLLYYMYWVCDIGLDQDDVDDIPE